MGRTVRKRTLGAIASGRRRANARRRPDAPDHSRVGRSGGIASPHTLQDKVYGHEKGPGSGPPFLHLALPPLVSPYWTSGTSSTTSISRRALRQFRSSDGPNDDRDVSMTRRLDVLAWITCPFPA